MQCKRSHGNHHLQLAPCSHFEGTDDSGIPRYGDKVFWKGTQGSSGNIYVTGPRGVWVISPEAEHLGTIEVPENVGNLTWGGLDWHTRYMPSSTTLYAIRTKVGARRESYMG